MPDAGTSILAPEGKDNHTKSGAFQLRFKNQNLNSPCKKLS
jgi:hypothetical protein